MATIEVKITSMYPPNSQGSIRAYASVTIENCFGVRGIKIVEGGEHGLFVSMPSRKTQDGFKDICFPVTAEFREQFHKAVLEAYGQAISQSVAGQGNVPMEQEGSQPQEGPAMQM